MAIQRSYADSCAAAHALDLVGERWALLIVRELLLGPKRYTDLRAGLRGISPNVLAQRLNELETALVLRRRKLPPPASARVYELTEWGRELEPVLLQLARWGVLSPSFAPPAGLGVDSMVLSLRTMFRPDLAQGYAATLEIGLEHDQFRATVAGARLELARGSASQPDATIQTGTDTLVRLAYGKASLDDALRSGAFAFTGDKTVVERFLGLFSLPEGAFGQQAASGGTTK
ncbi:winged helix-turn-helix transcriptional regulator [Pollutimonas bauzanensis]|uniref:Transcriptional regulator, HxlR family n=1 Tax=Pollutimonas bauzanensis TaxID=658167 RepID=A0A1M5YFC0_9BURK|nr:winged helix-turn-helix transcriptional regulator [Pollutimonas bauzanensis]SHI10652.1 transcriptional regulator, HxlR family [Pollutimonas bauzanensis]